MRLIENGKGQPGWVPSAVLSKMIRKFHDQSPTLQPFLRELPGYHEIDAEYNGDHVFGEINDLIQPTIIHIRVGSNQALKTEMTDELKRLGFMELEVNDLIRNETERRTEVGTELLQMISAGKIIPANTIVQMLRKIIFSGQKNTQFILTNFPDIIEHVHEFEQGCAKITSVFFTTEGGDQTELKNNNLTLFNIDSLFTKEFRLKVTSKWDEQRFKE